MLAQMPWDATIGTVVGVCELKSFRLQFYSSLSYSTVPSIIHVVASLHIFTAVRANRAGMNSLSLPTRTIDSSLVALRRN